MLPVWGWDSSQCISNAAVKVQGDYLVLTGFHGKYAADVLR